MNISAWTDHPDPIRPTRSGADVMARSALAQETVFALRETIARLEGKPIPALAAAQAQAVGEGKERAKEGARPDGQQRPERLATGVAVLDEALDGGVPLNAITEIRSNRFLDAGVASGFALALSARLQAGFPAIEGTLPVLWIGERMATQEAGAPYPLGIRGFGLSTERFFHALPNRIEEALWLAEAALGSGAFGVTILEVRGNPKAFGLTESRRLALRAKAAGRPLLVLRHAAEEEASSAPFRFLAEPALAGERRLPDGSMLGGSIGPSVFRLTLEKSRSPAPLFLYLAWNAHDRQFTCVDPIRHALPQGKPAAHSRASLPAAFNRQDPAPALGSLLAFDRQAGERRAGPFERAS
jgi:protein ImuA